MVQAQVTKCFSAAGFLPNIYFSHIINALYCIICMAHVDENLLLPLQCLISRDSPTGSPVDTFKCIFTSLHTFRAYIFFLHEQAQLLSVAFPIRRIKTSVPWKGHSQDQLASISQAICCACLKASAANLCGLL